MLLKWFPWKFLVRYAARRHGFLDPVEIISRLENFAQPSEVAAPTELIRSGVVLHARGLINSLAIQHNLDWIWPFWVQRQYDPASESFIPRAFSLTQINLTQRNWTALGVPGSAEYSLVDPRGLVTPCYDGWSIDVWIIPASGEPLIPSRAPQALQELNMDGGLSVTTITSLDKLTLQIRTQVIGAAGGPVCQVSISGYAPAGSMLVVSLRPYNPEGVSFIHNISLLEGAPGWLVNKEKQVSLSRAADKYIFSYYRHGDVYSRLSFQNGEKGITCKVGMASAAALYEFNSGSLTELKVSVPLMKKTDTAKIYSGFHEAARLSWEQSLHGVCELRIPDENFKFLYDAALRTMVLHSPDEVYPGPYIYRRFWFRDAAFILKALLCVGLEGRVLKALGRFRARQTAQGYFLSQEGEWDSNGEALWAMQQYCELTGKAPPQEWRESVKKAGKWICKKRLPQKPPSQHAGLMPSGFSAEHLGPNDFYYWDDFWSIAGLRSAAFLCSAYGDKHESALFEREAISLLSSVNVSLKMVVCRLERQAIPASPYRRLDTGAIGSLVASYPLRVFEGKDPQVLDTVEYLLQNCLVHGGFFHDMTHSGINPYLTLHIAQVLLRAGDKRYFPLMSEVARLATSTGQWPEAIHPRTGGGCMGDGQHVWAAAEWVLMIRNCFVREEGERLILCSGIPQAWLDKKQPISFGPAPTRFGSISVFIEYTLTGAVVKWQAKWFAGEPAIEIALPGHRAHDK
jgi:hypothetical protein